MEVHVHLQKPEVKCLYKHIQSILFVYIYIYIYIYIKKNILGSGYT